MTDRERLINLLGIDSQYVKDCDVRECVHCGEGCLLGYKFEILQGGLHVHGSFLEMLENIKMLYSKEFHDYWSSINSNDSKRSRSFLPCSHTAAHSGCIPSKCNLLTNEKFMTEEFLERFRRSR
jgi:hypothetical protein